MTRYVIDSSVAFQWAVSEPDSAKALQLRDDYRNAVRELLAPDPFVPEIGNALVVAERHGRIPAGVGAQLYRDILQSRPILYASLPDLAPRAHAISVSSVAGVYDCLYVALAEREGCEFVTVDIKLAKNLGKQFPFIVP